MTKGPSQETIVAIATPPGKGAVAIVRASGDAVGEICRRMVATKSELRARTATFATILDERGRPLDRGLAISFPQPHSYTGEDMLELQIHGSPVVAREVARAMLACGARLAAPGEFTRRAFMNGKIALREAAAVADLIEAQTSAAARAALANLEGSLAGEVASLRDGVAAILTQLAAAIDFPDEVADPDRGELRARLEPLRIRLERLQREGEFGRLLREGLAVAIVGPPNAGKSSLLNALLGMDRAIVSEIAGTTRDTIEEAVSIDGIPVRLVDTAGLRAHADRLEADGIARTNAVLAEAAVALVVLDGSTPIGTDGRELLERTAGRPRLVLLNKGDVGTDPAALREAPEAIVGSVRDPATLEQIRRGLASAGWGEEEFDPARPQLCALHELEAVAAGRSAIEHACAALDGGEPIDFAAGELQLAFSSLGHVSEQVAAEEIVTQIFSRFCIGK